MLALIDGDIVCYRAAASVPDGDPEWIATSRVERTIKELLEAIGADNYRLFLTGTDNFRYNVDPEYKANRKDKPRPQYLPVCRDFVYDYYNAEIVDGYEADDALAMNQTEDTIIASIDKDLLQVPGRHYNFVKGEWQHVTPLEGLRSFYRNLLIGDTSDNIRGVDGIGKVKAARYVNVQDTEEQMFEVVHELYNDPERLLKNGKLMWLWRFPEDIWSQSQTLFSRLESTTEPEQEARPESS
jgi:DNA polymerase-1